MIQNHPRQGQTSGPRGSTRRERKGPSGKWGLVGEHKGWLKNALSKVARGVTLGLVVLVKYVRFRAAPCLTFSCADVWAGQGWQGRGCHTAPVVVPLPLHAVLMAPPAEGHQPAQ